MIMEGIDKFTTHWALLGIGRSSSAASGAAMRSTRGPRKRYQRNMLRKIRTQEERRANIANRGTTDPEVLSLSHLLNDKYSHYGFWVHQVTSRPIYVLLNPLGVKALAGD